MVNMYSFNPMMMSGAYNMYSGMMNNNANVYQKFENKYGYGNDFRCVPYAQPAPYGITPRAPKSKVAQSKFGVFLQKIFG